jgi:hypothetical protein
MLVDLVHARLSRQCLARNQGISGPVAYDVEAAQERRSALAIPAHILLYIGDYRPGSRATICKGASRTALSSHRPQPFRGAPRDNVTIPFGNVDFILSL